MSSGYRMRARIEGGLKGFEVYENLLDCEDEEMEGKQRMIYLSLEEIERDPGELISFLVGWDGSWIELPLGPSGMTEQIGYEIIDR